MCPVIARNVKISLIFHHVPSLHFLYSSDCFGCHKIGIVKRWDPLSNYATMKNQSSSTGPNDFIIVVKRSISCSFFQCFEKVNSSWLLFDHRIHGCLLLVPSALHFVKKSLSLWTLFKTVQRNYAIRYLQMCLSGESICLIRLYLLIFVHYLFHFLYCWTSHYSCRL